MYVVSHVTPIFTNVVVNTLRKHTYSNRILSPNNENFKIKNSGSFHFSAQNIDCGYSLEQPQRGSSNDYPQSMFLSRNIKINVYPCKPQFYCIKVELKWVKTTQACVRDEICKCCLWKHRTHKIKKISLSFIETLHIRRQCSLQAFRKHAY